MPRRRRPTFSNTGTQPRNITDYGSMVPNHRLASSGSSQRSGSSNDLADHRDANVSRSFRSTGFVDRWIRRGSASNPSRQHLLDHENGRRTSYDADLVGIPMDGDVSQAIYDLSEDESLNSEPLSRRSSIDSIDDVCMPLDSPREEVSVRKTGGRRSWPDISVLNDFSLREMKEFQETEEAEAAHQNMSNRFAVNEAEQGGPLRPPRFVPWVKASRGKDGTTMFDQYRAGRSNVPDYRFTYFRDDLPATIHSPSISGLLQPGQAFEDLFPPVPQDEMRNVRENSTKEESSLAPESVRQKAVHQSTASVVISEPATQDATTPSTAEAAANMHQHLGTTTPSSSPRIFPAPLTSTLTGDEPKLAPSEISVTEEPVPFWLDILNPTEEEMRVISKAFGIHPLTTEDIVLRETREKVELFHSYYFICFSSFDISRRYPQKKKRTRRESRSSHSVSSKTSSTNQRRVQEKLRPLAVYTIVFQRGVISVHYAPTPHTINVRRRIRLLRDYLNLTSDWISYALIDDITDGFAPMIGSIEEDVTAIEDAILRMHGTHSDSDSDEDGASSNSSKSGSSSTGYREWRQKGDMLRWIGESRKRVMAVLGLLGSKADVIKGFSKRVTEQWNGASRSEIALYLSDIQDHLVTMVQSLNHYEKLLARSHSNYLAQLNIDMTKTNNDMNDVLGKISALGTIVLPMNVITGLWGMNVLVPGQDQDDSLIWFVSLAAGMLAFGVLAYFLIQRYV